MQQIPSECILNGTLCKKNIVKEMQVVKKQTLSKICEKPLHSCNSVQNPFLAQISANLKNQNPTIHAVIHWFG